MFGNIHTQNTRFLRTVNRLFPTSNFLHSDNIRLHSIYLSSEYIVSNLLVIRYLLHMISRCHILVLDFTCYLLKTTTHNTFKVPLRRKFCIPFSLQLLKVEVINTYHVKFYIEIPTGRPGILIVKFSFVLPPLLDSKNGRQPHRELDLVAPRGI